VSSLAPRAMLSKSIVPFYSCRFRYQQHQRKLSKKKKKGLLLLPIIHAKGRMYNSLELHTVRPTGGILGEPINLNAKIVDITNHHPFISTQLMSIKFALSPESLGSFFL
jgi:hypothetical protein